MKLSTQLDARLARELRAFADETDRTISEVVNEAVAEYLAKSRVRAAFPDAVDEVVTEHAQLLERLAK